MEGIFINDNNIIIYRILQAHTAKPKPTTKIVK